MFSSYDRIRDILKCSQCGENLRDVVKVIPQCGSLICGDCYAELKNSAQNSDSYSCKSCSQTHSPPDDDFADVKPIEEIIQLRPEQKALTKEAQALKSCIEEIQSKINQLKAFNIKEEIDSYCDQIQLEVMEAVESSIQHLNRLGEEFVKEINDYRQGLLHSRSSILQTESTESNSALSAIKQELADLSRRMDEFSHRWNEYFTQINKAASDEEIRSARDQAGGFAKQLKHLNNKLMSDALNNQFMRFKQDQRLLKSKKHLGDLVYENSANGNIVQSKLLRTIVNSDKIRQVVFLQDGKLASISDENQTKIWNPNNGELLHELDSPTVTITCLVQFQNGWLASGSRDNIIRIWDLKGKRVQKMYYNRTEEFECSQWSITERLIGHTDSVFSLRVLPNENLASCSWDDSIKIWIPFSKYGNLITSMSGHGIREKAMPLGVFSGGNLVTCSNEINKMSILRSWNSENGDMTASICTGAVGATSMLVLSNDQVAVAFSCGAIRIFDFQDAAESKILVLEQSGIPCALYQLPNEYLLSSESSEDNNHFINVWNLREGQLVQSIATDHSNSITSFSSTHDGKLLASGSSDKSAKLWSVSY